MVHRVCLHVLGKRGGPSQRPLLTAPACLRSFIAASLRARPRPPRLHLFQLAGVRGGAKRSITRAQRRRCTYSTAHRSVWGCQRWRRSSCSGMQRQRGHTDNHTNHTCMIHHLPSPLLASFILSSSTPDTTLSETGLYQWIVALEWLCCTLHLGLAVNVLPWALVWCSSPAENRARW